MIKITESQFNEMKSASVDIFSKSGGNHWLLQITGEEGQVVFLPIKHQRGTYYKMKPLKTFSEAWIWSI